MKRYYLGVDWADKVHQVWVGDFQGNKVAEMKVAQTPEGMSEFSRWLHERRAQGIELWAAIEKPEGRIVDFLLDEGYRNISVLDISSKALERARTRLGSKADKVTWINSDITAFEPRETYDIWHDRAAFHFLTTPEQVSQYIRIAGKSVTGFMILGTFSKNGPAKCSGLDIQQYDDESLPAKFESDFEKIKCLTEDHTTPFGTVQNFVFCSFKKFKR